MNILCDRIRKTREYGQIRSALAAARGRPRRYPSEINGLCEGAAYAFLAALTCDEKGKSPALIVVPDEKTAVRAGEALSALGLCAEIYPVRVPVLYNMVSSHETEHERLSVLMKIQSGDIDAVIATCDAALGYTIPPETLKKSRAALVSGGEYSLDELREFLVGAGYVFSDAVDGRGQFSVRGGIVDIFPPQCEKPVRIEFFGDEIERMWFFDTFTQRKTEKVEKVEITPAREILFDAEKRKKVAAVIKKTAERADGEARAALMRELDIIENETYVPFSDKYICAIYPERVCLLDYFYADALVFALETSAITERLKAVSFHMTESVTDLVFRGLMPRECADFSKKDEALFEFMDAHGALFLNSFTSRQSGKLEGLYSFKTRTPPAFSGSFDTLCDDVRMYALSGSAVLILCGNDAEATALSEILSERGFSALTYKNYGDITDVPEGKIAVSSLDAFGFELTGDKFICLSLGGEHERRRSSYGRRRRDNRSSREKLMSYADLDVGDLVVHVQHGIGKYLGIESVLAYDGVRTDHIKIQYAGTGVLYVPCDKIDNISKYIGAGGDDDKVKLSKLGGGEWERTKRRVRGDVKSMAKELIALYAERMRSRGFAFSEDDDMQREFEETFEFEETEGQLAAAREIKSDMQKPVPMDRLLCGDVGFGKTEVALRAAFKAVEDGKQVAVLVPTTILAMQHYQTITSRFRAFPVSVDMMSRFRTPKQQQATLRALARGDVDILVGTHRILSDDIKFRDLGLLIIDEEQRFGVAHKEKLKQISKNIDVLTLTATPIPRTLGMAMSDIRDMSVLDEAPMDRLPVQTYVLEHDDAVLFEAIRRELSRSGQVFYLHNNISTIYNRASRLHEAFPDAEIAVAHGQMDRDELSDIWQALVEGHIDILVCTTIIETGVDVPNANTLIIDHAERMGLAQLHQIRGRVGRSARRAYAYFTFPHGAALTEVQTKRLQAIRDFTEFGSGFKIAMRDLEIRGAGDVLGARQSGHLESVGYDMYLKILNEAVLEERGEKAEVKTECTVNIARDSYIPETYIPSAAQRIDVYKKIARITSADDVSDIADELRDRYGAMPPSVETLMNVSLVRALGSECGFSKIEARGFDVTVIAKELDVAVWLEISEKYPRTVEISPSQIGRITLKNRKKEPIFEFVLNILKNYLQLKCKK